MTNWHPLAVEGVKLLELGRVDEARLLLRQAVGMHPFEAWPYIKLAQVEESIHSKIHLYEKSLEVEPTDWAFIGLITTHISEDRVEAAYRAYVRARRTLGDLSRLQQVVPRIIDIAEVFEDPTFDWRRYLANHPTLVTTDKNPIDVAVKHYLDVERYLHLPEGERPSLKGGFNAHVYRVLNPDLAWLSDEKLLSHFHAYSLHDAPLYSLKNIPKDFDPGRYRKLNPDLAAFTDREAVVHFVQYGSKERRMYNTGFQVTDGPVLHEGDLAEFAEYRNSCVALINHEVSLSGAPLFFQSLADRFAAEGYFSNIVILDPHRSDAFEGSLRSDRIKRICFNDDPDQLERILHFLNPVVVYSNSVTLYLKHLERFHYLQYRSIFHLHETVLSAALFRDLEILRESRTYVVSDQLARDYQESGLENVRVFPPFLPERLLARMDEALRQAPSKVGDRLTVGMCGWISERKGFELFQYVAEQRPDIDFIWIGGQEHDAMGYKRENLKIVPFTTNPYEHFCLLDHFFLTSKQDPCPLVLLEALYLNLKIILLEGGSTYEHPSEKLDNVVVIPNHGFTPEGVLSGFNSLQLTRDGNPSHRNPAYIKEEFSSPRIYRKSGSPTRDVVALSYYIAPDDSPFTWRYYSNIINQFILRNDHEVEVIIQFASQQPITSPIKEHFSSAIKAPLRMLERPNRGYDIGGLADTVKLLIDEAPTNDPHIIYFHTKGNPIKREYLHKVLFCDDYRQFDTTATRQYVLTCGPDDLNRPVFFRHELFQELRSLREPFEFVAGTTFITRLSNLRTLHERYDEISASLTDLHTDDVYWRELMLNERIFRANATNPDIPRLQAPIDPDGPEIVREKGCKNYFELLHVHGKRGIPDCQFEHSLERLVGYWILNGKRVRLV